MASLTTASSAAAPEPLPVTERENELTRTLDAASPLGVVRLLRQTDAQVFTGYLDYPSLADDVIREKIVRSIDIVEGVLREYRRITEGDSSSTPVAKAKEETIPPKVVMSGSGTSGRLGFLVAREMNRVVASLSESHSNYPPPFGYCVSGGDPALLLSDELPEDDPETGVSDWLRETGQKDTHAGSGSCLIGITCGLSAPYVAGQVDHILDVGQEDGESGTPRDSAILIGFNPASLARNKPIEIWKRDPKRTGRCMTVRDVVSRLVSAEATEEEGKKSDKKARSNFCLLNPVVGPEPVCASSRMKGGTCTKVLLDVVLATAVARVFGLPLLSWTSDSVATASVRVQVDAVLDAFASAYAKTYSSSSPAISRVLAQCGHSLRQSGGSDDSAEALEGGKGHVYWSGAGAAGIMAAIDASEMPDTYGAAFDETRAFVFGGWAGVGISQMDPNVLHQSHPLFRISYTHFVEDILGGEVQRIPKIKTPQLIRYKSGANKLTHHDTIIDVCDIWPCDGADGGNIASKGITDGILGGDSSMPLTHCVDPATFSASQKDCVWAKARVGFTYLDGVEDSLAAMDSSTYGDLSVLLPRPPVWLLPGKYCGFDTLMLKLCLNAISTGAQCLKGMVYQNHMINTGPTNAKIYDRCVRLISRFAGVPASAAHTALLRAMYEEDFHDDMPGIDDRDLAPSHLSERVIGTADSPRTQSDHIKHVYPPTTPGQSAEYLPAKSVLPLAIILAAKGCSCTCREAAQMLQNNPLVRVALQEATQ